MPRGWSAMPREYLVATFAEPGALVEAVRNVRAHGFKIYDVYTPCPVHGLEEAMGLERSRLPWVTVVAGGFRELTAIPPPVFRPGFGWGLNNRRQPPKPPPPVLPHPFRRDGPLPRGLPPRD